MAQATTYGIPRERLRRLTARSDAAGALQLLGHLLGLGATAMLVLRADSAATMLLAMAVHGVLLVFLFAPLHETIHRTAFRSGWLNKVVAEACAVVLILPPRYFRAFHLRHHRYTQDAQRDPELPGPAEHGLAGYLWRMSGLPHWVANIQGLIRRARGKHDLGHHDARERRVLEVEARLYLGFYLAVAVTCLIAGSTLALTLWAVPALLGQPWLRMYLFAEHAGCPRGGDMLRNSRTVYTSPLLLWLAWNMPYHAEHHAHAAVPFHALPRVHTLLAPRLATTSRGYWRVHRDWLKGMLGKHAGPAT